MMLGNVERLEIVVRRFDLRPFDHAEADGKKNALELFVGLADQVPRAERALDAGQREVDVIAGLRLLFPRPLRFRCDAASSAASTWALSLFSSWPTTRLSSGGAGLSQLSVMSVSTPDLRPSQASRRVFQAASSVIARVLAEENSICSSANREATDSGVVAPRSASVLLNDSSIGHQFVRSKLRFGDD